MSEGEHGKERMICHDLEDGAEERGIQRALGSKQVVHHRDLGFEFQLFEFSSSARPRREVPRRGNLRNFEILELKKDKGEPKLAKNLAECLSPTYRVPKDVVNVCPTKLGFQ